MPTPYSWSRTRDDSHITPARPSVHGSTPSRSDLSKITIRWPRTPKSCFIETHLAPPDNPPLVLPRSTTAAVVRLNAPRLYSSVGPEAAAVHCRRRLQAGIRCLIYPITASSGAFALATHSSIFLSKSRAQLETSLDNLFRSPYCSSGQ
jgi:hypothetical protein